jgi:hypothetical protein
MDEAERQKLEAMNELEREMYLYEREEQRNAARMGKQLVDQARDQVKHQQHCTCRYTQAAVQGSVQSLPA